jgi:hypothetical protein
VAINFDNSEHDDERGAATTTETQANGVKPKSLWNITVVKLSEFQVISQQAGLGYCSQQTGVNTRRI